MSKQKPQYDLVILDPHVEAKQNLDRFRRLNKMIHAHDGFIKNIICVGDYASLDSLSRHEQPGSRSDQLRPTLDAELKRVSESQEILFDGVDVPTKNRYMVKGNHEHRFNRWAEANPALADSIDFARDSGFSKHWGTVKEYGEWINVRGILYTHVPLNGMGQPISGIWRTRTAALQSPASVIFGHSHNMQFSSVPCFGDGNKVRSALSGPAFQDGKLSNYAKNTQTGRSYGVLLVLPAGKDNGFSFHWITNEELKYYG